MIVPVDALFKAVEVLPLPPVNVEEAETLIAPAPVLFRAKDEETLPPVNVDEEETLTVPAPVLFRAVHAARPLPVIVQPAKSVLAVVDTPCAAVALPPTTRRPESESVPLVAVTLRQVVVPGLISHVMARTVDMVKTPPPVVAPAAVFVAVVSVARARAVPRFPAVPVPVD